MIGASDKNMRYKKNIYAIYIKREERFWWIYKIMKL